MDQGPVESEPLRKQKRVCQQRGIFMPWEKLPLEGLMGSGWRFDGPFAVILKNTNKGGSYAGL